MRPKGFISCSLPSIKVSQLVSPINNTKINVLRNLVQLCAIVLCQTRIHENIEECDTGGQVTYLGLGKVVLDESEGDSLRQAEIQRIDLAMTFCYQY